MWEALFAFHISIAQGSAELSRCSVCKRAVRPLAVVFLAPVVEGSPNVIQCAEPARVQAFVAKTSVEAFDVSVLHRSSWLDVDQVDPAFFCPAQHAPRCELRSVVGTHTLRLATLLDQLIQRSRHATAAKARISLQHQALARERIDHTEDANHPAVRQSIHDEVHRPLLVRTYQPWLDLLFTDQPFAPATAHRQPLLDIQPVDSLHVHRLPATLQNRMQPSISVTRLLPGQLHQLVAQLRVPIRSRLIPIAGSIHAQQLAGPALAQIKSRRDERNILS